MASGKFICYQRDMDPVTLEPARLPGCVSLAAVLCPYLERLRASYSIVHEILRS